MGDQHLTVELLRAIERGDSAPDEAAYIVYGHLAALCPHCRAALEAVSRQGPANGSPFSAFIPERESWLARAEAASAALDAGKRAAEPPVEQLLAKPADERVTLAERRGQSSDGAAEATLLLEKSLSYLPGQPQEALALARLACVVARHAVASRLTKVAYGRAMAHRGNAFRALGKLVEASEALSDARFLLQALGGGGALVQAELCSFEGSLRRAERRFPEAVSLLQTALDLFVGRERVSEAVATALKLGSVYREGGHFADAIAITRKALNALDPSEEPRLTMYARHNLADLLNDSHRPQAARRLLSKNVQLYARFPDPCSQLRHLWLEGKIARNLGDAAAAEQCFLTVRDGFLRQEIGYDAALVSMDLATLYLESGRTAETRMLAEEIAPVFVAQDVHAEAARALELFREAARREALTLALVAEVMQFLEAGRRNPALVFRAGLFSDLRSYPDGPPRH